MYPPTPTPLPPAPLAPITLNANMWRIWNFADDTIMVWQQFGRGPQQVLQITVLMVMLIGFVFLVRHWLTGVTEDLPQ